MWNSVLQNSNGSVQNSSISSVDALEILQFCTKQVIYDIPSQYILL